MSTTMSEQTVEKIVEYLELRAWQVTATSHLPKRKAEREAAKVKADAYREAAHLVRKGLWNHKALTKVDA